MLIYKSKILSQQSIRIWNWPHDTSNHHLMDTCVAMFNKKPINSIHTHLVLVNSFTIYVDLVLRIECAKWCPSPRWQRKISYKRRPNPNECVPSTWSPSTVANNTIKSLATKSTPYQDRNNKMLRQNVPIVRLFPGNFRRYCIPNRNQNQSTERIDSNVRWTHAIHSWAMKALVFVGTGCIWLFLL